MIDKKYCSSCGIYRELLGGKMISTANRKVRRWKCATCINNMATRKYQSKGKT